MPFHRAGASGATWAEVLAGTIDCVPKNLTVTQSGDTFTIGPTVYTCGGSTWAVRGGGTVIVNQIKTMQRELTNPTGGSVEHFNGIITGENSLELDDFRGTVHSGGSCDFVPPLKPLATENHDVDATAGQLFRHLVFPLGLACIDRTPNRSTARYASASDRVGK